MKDDGTRYYILLANDVIRKFSNSFLYKLNSKNNIRVYIILLDSYNYLQPYFKRCVNKVKEEHIYSFQKSDCEKWGYNYVYTLYSKVDLPKCNPCNISDAYFIGADKNRIDDIYSVYTRLKEFGYLCKFVVIIDHKKYEQYSKKYVGIDFRTRRITYTEILADIASTKCIVELCQKGQDGLTMRFYEALFYNKYLITNNFSAMTHPFYNSKYMQCFTDPNSIKYINLYQSVNYEYAGELSPVHLVDDIVTKRDLQAGFLK